VVSRKEYPLLVQGWLAHPRTKSSRTAFVVLDEVLPAEPGPRFDSEAA